MDSKPTPAPKGIYAGYAHTKGQGQFKPSGDFYALPEASYNLWTSPESDDIKAKFDKFVSDVRDVKNMVKTPSGPDRIMADQIDGLLIGIGESRGPNNEIRALQEKKVYRDRVEII